MPPFLIVFLATGFTFLMTAAGSATVFFFKKEIPDSLQRTFLGFAAGVMIAASVWSLLIPAISQSQALGMIGWLPPSIGFSLGSLSLLIFQHFLPAAVLSRNLLLFCAITLHNIPEGMAVGLAWPLALGIGIQNFPEGAAISLPLRKSGLSRTKAFLLGGATGLVEPLFGLLALLLVRQVTVLMPWLLSFAAGAMIYVVVAELIPEAQAEKRSANGTLGILAGFLFMMILDVSFG